MVRSRLVDCDTETGVVAGLHDPVDLGDSRGTEFLYLAPGYPLIGGSWQGKMSDIEVYGPVAERNNPGNVA